MIMAVISIVTGGLGLGMRWWRNREQQLTNKERAATTGPSLNQ
jgi:nitrogen fixation-related uncharacterized protein